MASHSSLGTRVRPAATALGIALLLAGLTVAHASPAASSEHREPAGLLWTADYDLVTDPLSVGEAWFREQEPRLGRDGPVQRDRIRAVAADEVPGSGPHKPAGKAMRVELRPYHATPGMADGDVNPSGNTNRAEVYDRYPPSSATSTPPERWPDPVGSTRWYGFSVYVPQDFEQRSDLWLTITQWKGMYGGSPPLALEIDGDEFELGGTTGRRPLGKIVPGTWTRFEFGMRWSPDARAGWVQVFRDGREVLPREARRTMDTYDGGKVDPVYLKQGIYRTTAWPVTHVLHFAPMKVGLSRADVSSNTPPPAPAAEPGGSPAPVAPPAGPGSSPDATAGPGGQPASAEACGTEGAGEYLCPAKLRVARARVDREDRVLDVYAPITSRARGEVEVTYQGDRRTDTFDAQITSGDATLDRIRFREPLTRGQAVLGTGIVTIDYKGDKSTRPGEVRLRAAVGRAELDVEEVSLIDGRLSARGSVTGRAEGIVRFRFSYLDAAGNPQIHPARATIQDDGDWVLEDDVVPPQLAKRGGYLSILFTGYFERRIRGEMLAYQLNPGQTRRP